MYDMINIFEVFLPQLLRYPNPSDPLNGDAAAVLMRDPKKYEARVRGMLNLSISSGIDDEMHRWVPSADSPRRYLEYVAKYASKDAADEAGEDTESDDEMSSVGSYESGGEEPAGGRGDRLLAGRGRRHAGPPRDP